MNPSCTYIIGKGPRLFKRDKSTVFYFVDNKTIILLDMLGGIGFNHIPLY